MTNKPTQTTETKSLYEFVKEKISFLSQKDAQLCLHLLMACEKVKPETMRAAVELAEKQDV